ncbi:MAG: winged helix-turn-helix domain-containing protein [Nocardioides marinisabuli]|uniref:helix-turn-helix transcriptional regulator n=1 Tax=Nocardioides marinisabuli TaxID=419476 RepID=UPI00321B1143
MTEPGARTWTLLSNHGHVLVALSRNPTARIRDLAVSVGITERAAQKILADLEEAGYVTRERVGRRNEYRLHPDRRLRHPAESMVPVRDLLDVFATDRTPED